MVKSNLQGKNAFMTESNACHETLEFWSPLISH